MLMIKKPFQEKLLKDRRPAISGENEDYPKS
jgi:hypothetical protein